MSRYHNFEYILNSDITFGINMIIEAMNQKRRDESYILYASLYPNFTKENFITFDQYYNKSSNKSHGSMELDKNKVMNKVSSIMETNVFKKAK